MDSFQHSEKLLDQKLKNLLSLFVWLIKSEDAEGIVEIGYIYNYFSRIYAEEALNEISSEFQDMLQREVDVDSVISGINEEYTPKDKMLLMILMAEIIVSDQVITERERRIFKFVANKLGVPGREFRFVEQVFGVEQAEGGGVSFERDVIRVAGGGECDVLFDIPGIDFSIYRVDDSYLIRNISAEADVYMGDTPLLKNKVYLLRIGEPLHLPHYTIYYEDTLNYFASKDERRRRTVRLRLSPEGFQPVESGKDCQVLVDIALNRITLTVNDKDTTIEINGRQRDSGAAMNVNLRDVIIVNHYARLDPCELIHNFYRQAELIPMRQGERAFTVSGSDTAADVFIKSPGLERLSMQVFRENGEYFLIVRDSPCDIFLNDEKLTTRNRKLENGDVLTFADHVIEYDGENQTIKYSRLNIQSIEVSRASLRFGDSETALDDISFKAHDGELVAIMGSSGCGKTTLLRVLNGSLHPQSGEILLNGVPLHKNYHKIKTLIGYVPHDEILFENLTVFENLFYAGKLRMPDIKTEELGKQIDRILMDLNLIHRRNTRVGSVVQKILSGGERKRINIAIELLTDPSIFFLDEPTTGLSSKDSEQIIAILKKISKRKKIVIATIHQPSSKMFKMFDKLVLLDQGGKLIYYGAPTTAIRYFREHEGESVSAVECPVCKSCTPEVIFDIVERPLRDLNSRPIFEKKKRGALRAKRMHTPQYWKSLFQTQVMRAGLHAAPKEAEEGNGRGAFEKVIGKLGKKRVACGQFLTLFRRNLKIKIRDPGNIVITFIGAPFLSWLISFVLKYTNGDKYSFSDNELYPMAVFLFLLISIFFGMTNSVNEIIRDRAIILREKMLSLSSLSYLLSKVLVLLIFALVQDCLILAIGSLVLEFHGMFWLFLPYLMATSLFGILFALFLSSIIRSPATASNLIPIILVPQIIFSGALLHFEQMNRDVTIIKSSPIPEFAQIMPSRWAFEGMMLLQSDYNPYTRAIDSNTKAKSLLTDKRNAGLAPEVFNTKMKLLRDEQEQIINRRYMYENVDISKGVFGSTGKGDMEKKNVFLSRYKFLFGRRFETARYDFAVLFAMLFAVFVATLMRLRFALR